MYSLTYFSGLATLGISLSLTCTLLERPGLVFMNPDIVTAKEHYIIVWQLTELTRGRTSSSHSRVQRGIAYSKNIHLSSVVQL